MPLLLIAVLSGSLSPPAECRSPVPFDASTREVGTGGSWQNGERHGRFRYFLFARGSEHVSHTLEIEILEYLPDELDAGGGGVRVIGCVDTGELADATLWFVQNVRFASNSTGHTELQLDVAYAENPGETRQHIIELRVDGKLRIIRQAWPRP